MKTLECYVLGNRFLTFSTGILGSQDCECHALDLVSIFLIYKPAAINYKQVTLTISIRSVIRSHNMFQWSACRHYCVFEVTWSWKCYPPFIFNLSWIKTQHKLTNCLTHSTHSGRVMGWCLIYSLFPFSLRLDVFINKTCEWKHNDCINQFWDKNTQWLI